MRLKLQIFFSFLGFLSLSVLEISLAQSIEPSAGIILRKDRLDEMIRNRGAEAIFNQFRGQIAEQIRQKLKEAELGDDGQPHNVTQSSEINVSRELLRKPVLQMESLPELQSSQSAWLNQIRSRYVQIGAMSDEEIESEMRAWQDFFSELPGIQALDEEKQIDFVDAFFLTRVRESDPKSQKRFEFLPADIPLFKMQKQTWLDSLRKAYTGDLSESPAWVEASLANWSLFFDEAEDWSVYVDYNFNIHPNFEAAELSYGFQGEGPLARADFQLTKNPVLDFQSINIFLRNPSTGELISVYGFSKEASNESREWRFSKPMQLDVKAEADFDLQRDSPIGLSIQEMTTNLGGVQIRAEDVEQFLGEVLSPSAVIQAVDELKSYSSPESRGKSFADKQTYDRVVSQLESDVKNVLQDKKLKLVVYLTSEEGSKTKTHVGVLTEERADEIAALKREGRLVLELQTDLDLNIQQAVFEFDPESSKLMADIHLPRDNRSRWRVSHFDFPAFLFDSVDHSLVDSIVQRLNDEDFEIDTMEVKALVHFPDADDGIPDIKVGVPVDWIAASSPSTLIPQIQVEKIEADLAGTGNAYIEEVGFRADETLPWVEYHFQAPRKLSDQTYDQLDRVMQNVLKILGEDFVYFMDETLGEFTQDRISGLKVGYEESASASLKVQMLNFLSPRNAVNVNWHADEELKARILELEKEQRVLLERTRERFDHPQTFLPANARVRGGNWQIQVEETRRRNAGPNTFTENPTYTVKVWRDLSKADLDQRRERAVQAELLKQGPPDLVSGFDLLPEAYRIYENQRALHRVRTTIKLPKSFRLRLENIDTEEALIGLLEMTMESSQEQEVEIYWKFVQDAQGRLIMLPELTNLHQALKSYKPVVNLPVSQGGPLVANVQPKNGFVRGVENGALVGQIIGIGANNRTPESIWGYPGKWAGEVMGWASRGVTSEIEDIKDSKVQSQLVEKVGEAIDENLPKIMKALMEKANGYVLRAPGEEAGDFDAQAALPAMQSKFEEVVDASVDKFKLRSRFAEVRVNEEQGLLEKISTDIESAVADTARGEGPLESWPRSFTNPGLSELWLKVYQKAEEQVAGLPSSNEATLLGSPGDEANPDLISFYAIAGRAIPGILKTVNGPFQNIEIGSDEGESVFPEDKPVADEPVFDVSIPEHICIAGPEATNSEDLISIWAYRRPLETSGVLQENPAPSLDSLLERYLADRPDWAGKAPDGIVAIALSDIQEEMIEPNLEPARQMLQKEVSANMPGTEVLLGHARVALEMDTETGEMLPVAYAQMRLKQKAGLIKFDSGSDFVEVKMPLEIFVGNEFQNRPEVNGENHRAGYDITVRANYPIHIVDPNSGNIVDHWIKKYIAYPKLGEAIVMEEKQKNGTQMRRQITTPIPLTLGVPTAEQAVPLSLGQPDFQLDADGKAYVVVPIDFVESQRQNSTGTDSMRVQISQAEVFEDLSKYVQLHSRSPDFAFRQVFENLLVSSRTKTRSFHTHRKLDIDFQPLNAEAMIQERDGKFYFEALVKLKQSGDNPISLNEPLAVSIPFEVFEGEKDGASFWLLDAEVPEFRSLPNIENLNEPSLEFLKYLEEANPEPLKIQTFRP